MRRVPPPSNMASATVNLVSGVAALGGLRLPVTAFSVAAVQSLIVEENDGALLRYLELPLVVVIALSLTRPGNAVVTGFLFGLAVDAFHTKLFGLHGLAYCILGPLAAVLPVGGLRGRVEIVASLAAAQTLAATIVVVIGTWISVGHLDPGLFGRVVQTTLWTVGLVIPLTVALGGRMGLATPEPIDRLGPPTSAEWR